MKSWDKFPKIAGLKIIIGVNALNTINIFVKQTAN